MKPQIPSPRSGGLRLPAKPVATLFTLLCALGRLAAPAHATNRTWTGAVNGNWSEPGNWNPSSAPQNGDNLTFDNTGSNKSMRNDLSGLVLVEIDFNNGNYTLNGNTLTVSYLKTLGDTVTINSPLDFPAGWSSAEADASGAVLYLNGAMTTPTNATPNVRAFGGRIYVAGAISGDGDFHVFAGGANSYVEFDGAQDNTFSGALYLEGEGQVAFNKSSGHVVNTRLVVATLQVTNYVNLNLMQADQIGGNTTLEIPAGTQLYLSGNNATCQGIIIGTNSGNLSAKLPTTLVTSGDELLGLNGGGISASCDDTNTPTIKGRLNLNGVAPFDVHGAAGIGLQIDAVIEGVGFRKIGNSTLILDGTNSFTGTAEVDEGILDVRSAGALGLTNGGTVLNGGSLTLRTSVSGETLTAQAASTNGDSPDLPGSSLFALSANPITWNGPITLDTNLDVFGDDITFSGQIYDASGRSGLGLFNLGTVQIAGSDPNYLVKTLVRCSLLELNKTAGGPSSVPAYGRTLEVGGGFGGPYEVRWLTCCQSGGEGRNLVVFSNGVVNLNNFDDNFDSVTFTGGEIETGGGECEIGQTITVNPANTTALINGDLRLGVSAFNGPVSVDVGLGAADPGLQVNAIVSGYAELDKAGAGTLSLNAANTFNNTTHVVGGTLLINNPLALSTSDCAISDGATLKLNVNGSIPNNLETSGAGVNGTNGAIEAAGASSATLSGSIQLDTNTAVNVASGASLSLNGLIFGTGSLTKTGAGPLTLAGDSPNTYAGDTTDQAGLLYLSKSGTTLVAVPGNLVLGPAPANAAASAILLSPNSIGGAVTVNANSSLNLNGRNQTLSQLNLNDGGSVQTGPGQLLLTSGANVNVGSLRSGIGGGSHVSASITGNIGLPPNSAAVNFNVNPYAFFFPFDSRPELDLPAAIVINGYEDPNQVPTGISKNGGGRMRLGGSAAFQGGAVVNGGALQVDGTLPNSGYVVVNDGGTLQGAGSVGRVIMNGASATLAPGDSPGILTCYNFDAIGSGFSGVLNVELNGTTPGSGYSQVVSGPVNLNGISLTATLGYQPNTNDQFVIIQNNATGPYSAVAGTFNGLPEGAGVAIGDQVFQVTYHGGDGNDVVLKDVGKLVVPELRIERADANRVRLLWATNTLSFALQSATNLPATNWSAVSPPPAVVGTNNVVTNATDAAERFYRLRTP